MTGGAPTVNRHPAPVRMFEGLLPSDVVVSCREAPARDRPPADGPDVIGEVSEARRLDFVTGRACASEALRQAGVSGAEVTRGTGGEPVWPTGFVGSITHCTGVFAAAVATTDRYRAIGIDAEPLHELSPDMLTLLQGSGEQRGSSTSGVEHVDLVNFSAKESIYKVWYPLTRSWLDFLEATVEVDPDGTFSATIHHHLAARHDMAELRGAWRVHDGTVFTAIALPRRRNRHPHWLAGV